MLTPCMSAVWGKADAERCCEESPLMTHSGHPYTPIVRGHPYERHTMLEAEANRSFAAIMVVLSPLSISILLALRRGRESTLKRTTTWLAEALRSRVRNTDSFKTLGLT
jgi:hypothetical protein